MRASRVAAVVLALICSACNEDQGRPRPLQVLPGSASNQQDTPVTIRGERFRVLVHANFEDSEKSRVDRRFTVRLGGVELTGVTYVSPTTLEATVQAGLPPGTHDLEVVDPRGLSGVLPNAFAVLGASDAAAEAQPVDGAAEAQPVDAAAEALPWDGTADARPPDAGPDGALPDAAADDAGGDGTVQALLADPFGDATSFSFVFKYGGQIYLGPNADGTSALRINPDGSDATKIGFAFFADTSGNSSRNKAAAPYPSIGHAGCAVDTPQCGPDNEDGRGIFAAGNIGGTEWLVIAGARTAGDLDYVYMTSDTDDVLDMRYVDLSPMMGPQTRGSSTMHVLGNRVYLGFPDTGGKRPYLVALKATPGAPGLDTATTSEAESMGAHAMPNIGLSAPMSMIDAMTDFNNRVYVLNNGGCMHATVAQPASYETKASDWADCTPSHAAYTAETAITTSKVAGIEPADKAFSQLAVHHGRLYAGRNTTAGPQLWVCNPTTVGDTGHCDPDDWQLVAPNSSGSPTLTQLNNPANTRITLVASTGAHLYVGFDNAQGGVLFRSASTLPTVAADFTGNNDCAASTHPAGCAGLGGPGLGQPTNTRFFFAAPASFGSASYLYLTTGSGSGPVKVYRIVD